MVVEKIIISWRVTVDETKLYTQRSRWTTTQYTIPISEPPVYQYWKEVDGSFQIICHSPRNYKEWSLFSASSYMNSTYSESGTITSLRQDRIEPTLVAPFSVVEDLRRRTNNYRLSEVTTYSKIIHMNKRGRILTGNSHYHVVLCTGDMAE